MKRFLYRAALDFNEEFVKAPPEIWAYMFTANDNLMFAAVIFQIEIYKVGRWFWRKLTN